jgi:hypothetical protein
MHPKFISLTSVQDTKRTILYSRIIAQSPLDDTDMITDFMKIIELLIIFKILKLIYFIVTIDRTLQLHTL